LESQQRQRRPEVDTSKRTLHHKDLDIETIEAAECFLARLANIVTCKVHCRGRQKVYSHPKITYCESPNVTSAIVDERN
jgi:hypothetical protein